MSISIRLLEEAELSAADAVLRLAFESKVSRVQDLRLYRQIQPDGWFGAFQGESLVGTAGAANYGAFAHVGLMSVHPDAQRQGIGLALMQFLLADLERQGVPLVTLDASAAGRPLYEKLGFVPYDGTLVYHPRGIFPARPQPAPIHSLSARDLDELVACDTRIFGADRRKVFQVLLEAFPGRAFMQRDADGQITGYLFAQMNRIGPWVMRQPQDAEALLLAALSLSFEEPPSLNVPAGNRETLELLQRYGFEQVRSNLHMGRGAGGPPGQRQKIYSQTSLAVG
jgi:predicted N-acetyltransferase YhbS